MLTSRGPVERLVRTRLPLLVVVLLIVAWGSNWTPALADEPSPVEWRGVNNAGRSVASGVYFYKLVTKGYTQTKKMVLLK